MIKSIWHSIKRTWSKWSQPGTGGLVQRGDWRVRYPDGKVTYYLSYGDAANLRSIFGGELEWKYDVECDAELL